jgi:hypothetical protein
MTVVSVRSPATSSAPGCASTRIRRECTHQQGGKVGRLR